MHKQSKQSLDSIDFLQDLTPENAVKYSGGVVSINNGSSNSDVILYSDSNFRGRKIGINASTGDGARRFPSNFNDVTSSVKVQKGTWIFYKDANYGGGNQDALLLEPGDYKLIARNRNDQFSSARRVV